jgi:hypothetical protein
MASNAAPEGLMPAPLGVIPDFDVNHYNSTQIQFILAYSITLFFAAITLLLRLYTRIFLIQGFGLDDGEFSLPTSNCCTPNSFSSFYHPCHG